MAYVVAFCLLLVPFTLLIHFLALQWALRIGRAFDLAEHRWVLLSMCGLLLAHLLEIGIFAGGFFLLDEVFDAGGIQGELEGNALDYVYFSIAMYTTLGVGDIMPEGPLRFVAGLESLVGLVMITWSASFTYASVPRFGRGASAEKGA